jgi:hypothetical protein
VTSSHPQERPAEEPQAPVLEVRRPPLSYRTILTFTILVTAFAMILVALLYMSPLAAR